MKKFKMIEHTADIGIDVYGSTVLDLFVHSAKGMFAIISGNANTKIEEDFSCEVNLQGEDFEDMLVTWLSELLFICETKRVILTSFNIGKVSKHHIEAGVKGRKIEHLGLKIEKEIKAVTYHNLEIKKNKITGIWQTRIIFDI